MILVIATTACSNIAMKPATTFADDKNSLKARWSHPAKWLWGYPWTRWASLKFSMRTRSARPASNCFGADGFI